VGTPFGLSPISSIFQRVMSHIFRDLPFTFPCIDNLPFASKNWEEHAEHAMVILDRLNKANLKIKPSPIKIGYSQIRCLGHMISHQGVGMDPDELQSFLGFATFIRQHIRHFADLTAPLESIKRDKLIEWSPELISHFNTIKNAVLKAPFLQYPDYSYP